VLVVRKAKGVKELIILGRELAIKLLGVRGCVKHEPCGYVNLAQEKQSN
jgi:hypothetical protein